MTKENDQDDKRGIMVCENRNTKRSGGVHIRFAQAVWNLRIGICLAFGFCDLGFGGLFLEVSSWYYLPITNW